MVSKLVKTVVKQTTPIIIFFSLIELIAGISLGEILTNVSALPGILILIPPLLAMRGNIGASLGARISSGLHLGYVRPNKFTKDLKANIYSSLILSLFMSIMLAIFVSLACVITGSVCIDFIPLSLITITAGFTSGVVLVLIGVLISILSHNKGLDPDNVTTPIIATLGDVVTIVVLVLVIKIFLVTGVM